MIILKLIDFAHYCD